MNCQFQRQGELLVCPVCGASIRTAKETIRRNCGRPVVTRDTSKELAPAILRDFSCTHRGEVIRSETCKPCNGSRIVPVNACDIHRECSIHAAGIRGDGGALVKVCISCGDREPQIVMEQESGVAGSRQAD